MHVLQWKSLYFHSNFTDGSINDKSALVHVMAWHRTGDQPSPEPILTLFTDAYNWGTYGSLEDNKLRAIEIWVLHVYTISISGWSIFHQYTISCPMNTKMCHATYGDYGWGYRTVVLP